MAFFSSNISEGQPVKKGIFSRYSSEAINVSEKKKKPQKAAFSDLFR
jgi:hypothetical protein